MIANLTQWEGKLVNGEFPLQRWLGGSDYGAVFLVEKTTDSESRTAIRFLDANLPDAREWLQGWETASKLRHPSLLRIFRTGRCQIDGDDFFYVLIEFAQENLSQILPQRSLSVEETREVLVSVLPALTYIHDRGFVHGSLKPSHVFAVDNTIKISSDTLRPAGRPLLARLATNAYGAPETAAGTLAPSADVWSLGVTLCEALTQRLPDLDGQQEKQPTLPQEIPQPFREIVENCLQFDPARRWSLAQIAACLAGERIEVTRPVPVAVSSPAAPESVATPPAPREVHPALPFGAFGKWPSPKWLYGTGLVAAVVVAIVLLARPKPASAPPSVQPAEQNAPAPSSSHPVVVPVAHRGSEAAPNSAAAKAGRGWVVERLKPRVLPSALHTIHGRVRILLDLDVDEAGDVTEARLQSGKSRYFIRHSLDAARTWKFQPPLENGQPVASQWLVEFTYRRGAVDDSARQIRP